jgi:hypothetical protein
VILARTSEVLDGLAEIAAVGLGAALAGGADKHERETRLKRHRDQRGLAVARHALDTDTFAVDGAVGLEVVEPARGSPRPGAERAPIVGMARLAAIDEADDALGEARAVIGLDAGGRDTRIAPTGGDEEIDRRRAAGHGSFFRSGRGRAGRWRNRAGAEHHQDGDGRLRRGGHDDGHADIHGDGGKRGVVDMADQLLRDHRHAADLGADRLGDGPGDRWNILRHAAHDLSLEILDDLGAAQSPPLVGRGDSGAVFQDQGIGIVGKRVGLGGIVVGRIDDIRAGAATRAGTQLRDAELRKHGLVILIGGPVHRLRRGLGEAEGGTEEGGGGGEKQTTGHDGVAQGRRGRRGQYRRWGRAAKVNAAGFRAIIRPRWRATGL